MKPIVLQKYRLFETETARQRVLSTLLLSPNEEFSLTELADISKVSKSSASRAVEVLRREGVLEVMEARIVWRIKANTQSWAYLREKIPFNLSLIYRSGLVDFLVRKFNTPRAIVLFGSFRQGQDLGGSDIDIAIQSNEVAELTVLQLPELKPLEAQIKRPIKIYLFNPRNIDLNLFNSIANGIVLYGFLEVRP